MATKLFQDDLWRLKVIRPDRLWSVMACSPPRIGKLIPILVHPMNRALGETQVGNLKRI